MQAKGHLRKQSILYVVFSLSSVIAIIGFAFHRSDEPWIFGRYSLPYFVFLVLFVITILFAGALVYRFRAKALYVILASTVVFLAVIIAIEIITQIYALLYPSYHVLSLEPDRAVGWKQVPGLRWTWAGHHWYAREFSVAIETNSHGFRDVERELSKPAGVVRIALLGDSLVEAVQVPFNKTAGQLLEQGLNRAAEHGARARKYEVLNFGISNYGVGQYLLTWEQYAAKFNPDYVFILVAGFHMERTVLKTEVGGFPSTQQKELWVRPTFRLERGELVREEAGDFAEFVKVQEELINTDFGGKRILRKHGFFNYREYFGNLWFLSSLKQIQKNFSANHTNASTVQDLDDEIVTINLRLIEELGRAVGKMRGYLVIVDASHFFKPKSKTVARILEKFCTDKQFGYIPLSDYLLEAKEGGISPTWTYDGHFNEAGNKIFAEAMHHWMANNVVGKNRL